MLAAATYEIAARAATITVVSRSGAAVPLPGTTTTCHALKLDWSFSEQFVHSLRRHAEQVGAPDFALAWLHQDSLALELAGGLCLGGAFLRFVHVRSSVSRDPTRAPDDLPSRFLALPRVTYQQVVLGFIIEREMSRWLTHSEICTGTLSAIDGGAELTIVGTVSPWSARP